uniref:Zinc-ribbon domain protein n=1 Tax=Siphoviridae sp. ctvok7 TaxID=2827596 RepID=A0A8S5LLX6_9CAUD|nr:MAG TPA: zinc-ribbon domain protein [Siphoviridae sp. ctvok7]
MQTLLCVSCGCVNQGECKGGTSKHFCCLCWIFREKDCLWIYVEVRIVKEYIERAVAMDAILGLTIADPAVAQYADAVCYHLQNLPAADVAEVRHGRWMTTDAYPHHLYCSVCYKTYSKNAKWVNELDLPTNYCPNCGARMEKEDEHEAG